MKKCVVSCFFALSLFWFSVSGYAANWTEFQSTLKTLEGRGQLKEESLAQLKHLQKDLQENQFDEIYKKHPDQVDTLISKIKKMNDQFSSDSSRYSKSAALTLSIFSGWWALETATDRCGNMGLNYRYSNEQFAAYQGCMSYQDWIHGIIDTVGSVLGTAGAACTGFFNYRKWANYQGSLTQVEKDLQVLSCTMDQALEAVE